MAELEGSRRRVLHAACGDGWLVQLMAAAGTSTATGSIPGPVGWPTRSSATWTCARSPSSTISQAVEPGALGGVVLSGVMEGSGHGERRRLVEGAVDGTGTRWRPRRPQPGPVELGRGRRPPRGRHVRARPYRPGTWSHVLGRARAGGGGDRGGPTAATTWCVGRRLSTRRPGPGDTEGRLRHAPLRPRDHGRGRDRRPGSWPSTSWPTAAGRSRSSPPAPSTTSPGTTSWRRATAC